MAVELVLRVMCVFLLTVGCLSSVGSGEIDKGCSHWITSADSSDVCCSKCYPGNRLVRKCGPDPKVLCVPCENNRYTTDPITFSCRLCTQCVGAHKLKNACTKSKDTKCECKAGFRCGDETCSVCVDECGKGQEPIPEARSCQDCPNGTFNDQIHEKCKPWRKSCPHPSEKIVALGNAVSDSKCATVNNSKNVIISPTIRKDSADDTRFMWVICIFSGVVVIICTLGVLHMYICRPKKTTPNQQTVTCKPLIEPTPPTDDPRSLMEVSFHQPQQEQGSSSESLYSQDSETKLLHV